MSADPNDFKVIALPEAGPEEDARSIERQALPQIEPVLAGHARELEDLNKVVTDAASVGAGLWLSYLFVLFYLSAATATVTHRDLLYQSPVKLPFLNVDLPLVGFFSVAPLLLLVVHGYVLLHIVLLTNKIGAFDKRLAALDDEELRASLRWKLPSNVFVQLLAGPSEIRAGTIGLHVARYCTD